MFVIEERVGGAHISASNLKVHVTIIPLTNLHMESGEDLRLEWGKTLWIVGQFELQEWCYILVTYVWHILLSGHIFCFC